MRQALVAALALGALAGCGWFERDDDADRTRTGRMEDDEFYRTTDPVTGARVESDTPYRYDHMGRTYYFSSEESLARFRDNPSEYVDNEGRIHAQRRADWERERTRDVR